MASEEKIVLYPVGYVKSKYVNKGNRDIISQIVIKNELIETLQGIEDFSHIFVLFYFDRISPEKKSKLKLHPKGRADLPLVGTLGSRSMLHPNPIGLTLVEIIKVEENILTVKGLDAYDDTPVLDIKPYDPEGDAAVNAKVPDWWNKI